MVRRTYGVLIAAYAREDQLEDLLPEAWLDLVARRRDGMQIVRGAVRGFKLKDPPRAEW